MSTKRKDARTYPNESLQSLKRARTRCLSEFRSSGRAIFVSVAWGVALGTALAFGALHLASSLFAPIEHLAPAPATTSTPAAPSPPPPPPTPSRTLVFYWYHSAEPQSRGNLRYYLRHGVHTVKSPAMHWIFLPQGMPPPEVPHGLSDTVLFHEQPECSLLGTVGLMMKRHTLNVTDFTHYVFLTSSVMGPFLPVYLQGSDWIELMRGQLQEGIHAAASTISCADTVYKGKTWATPHMDFTGAVLVDAAALSIMSKRYTVLKCHEDVDKQRFFSETGATRVLLVNGMGIASLQPQYRGVDWLNNQTWDCGGRQSPFASAMFDDVGLHPHLLLFVPVTVRQLRMREWSAVQAQQLDRWNEEPGDDVDTPTGWTEEDLLAGRLPVTLWASVHLPLSCFNATRYRQWYPALEAPEPVDAWLHYLNEGLFEELGDPFDCHVPGKELYPYIQDPLTAPYLTPSSRFGYECVGGCFSSS